MKTSEETYFKTIAGNRVACISVLGFKCRKQPVKISFVGWDVNICLAQTPYGPILTKAIENEADAMIAYQTSDSRRIMFDISFAGLKQAVASIR